MKHRLFELCLKVFEFFEFEYSGIRGEKRKVFEMSLLTVFWRVAHLRRVAHLL